MVHIYSYPYSYVGTYVSYYSFPQRKILKYCKLYMCNFCTFFCTKRNTTSVTQKMRPSFSFIRAKQKGNSLVTFLINSSLVSDVNQPADNVIS